MAEKDHATRQRKITYWIFILITVVGLYLTTKVNYLLFHSIVEMFSIIVAASVFIITWNSARYIKNPYLIMVGVSYLFIGILDLLHTLSYKGMPIFSDYDYYANQLWIAARFLESCTLLGAFILLFRKKLASPGVLFGCYTAVTTLLILSIFHWKIFPICFIDGKGLTPFKICSEYLICAILAAALMLLSISRSRFTDSVYRLLFLSILYAIISELSFTFYMDNYGFSNLVGHYFKLFSFMMIYKALIATGIDEPYQLIFRELSQTNDSLLKEIELRAKTEAELKNASAALREGEQEQRRQRDFLECLLNNTGVCIAVLQGHELRFTMANPPFLDIAGNGTTVGRTYREVFPEGAKAGTEAMVRRVLETGEPWVIDEYQPPITGNLGVLWQGQVVRLPLVENKEPSALAVVWDITGRKQAEERLRESESRYRSLFENIQEMVTVYEAELDELGRVSERRLTDANRVFLKTVGVSSIEDIRGKTSEEIFGKSWSGFHLPAIQEALDTGRVHSQELFRPESGRHYMTSVVPLSANTYMDTGWDITDRKEAENILKSLNESLEKRVAERTAELREKDQMLLLQSRQAAMGEMISNIAHQWRQPLNSVGLVIQGLLIYYDMGKLDREFLVNNVQASMQLIKHMSATIEDFRNYFKPDKEREDFRLSDAIAKTLALLEGSFKHQNIRVEVDTQDDLIINGYFNEFAQALLNILNNARDAIRERGIENPRVIVTAFNERGKAIITIADNAGGIREEIIEKIFDPYFTTKGPQQGTGIGLYMSKAIIEKNMGGRLSVCNTAIGAQFRIDV